MPASAASSARRSRLSDVVEAGLMTTVLPGRQRRAELPGRHLGREVPRQTAPTTPTGSRMIVATVPRAAGATWPYSLSIASACQRMHAAVSGMSRPTVSVIGLPASMVSISPSSRAFASIRSAQASRTRLRSRGPSAPTRRRSAARTGSRDGRVHVGCAALGDVGDRLPGRRVLGHESASVVRWPEVAIDEQIRAQAQAGELARGLFPIGDQRVGHRGVPRAGSDGWRDHGTA